MILDALMHVLYGFTRGKGTAVSRSDHAAAGPEVNARTQAVATRLSLVELDELQVPGVSLVMLPGIRLRAVGVGEAVDSSELA